MSERVALVCGSWPPCKCGVGDFTRRLAVELAAIGVEPLVVTLRSASVEQPRGVQVLRVVDSWGPAALPAVLQVLGRADVSLVNLQYPTQEYGRISLIDLLPVAVRVRLGLPVVSTIHEYTTFHRAGRLRVRNLVRSSSAAIVPDPVNRSALAASLPKAQARLYGVPLGPNIERGLPAGFDRQAWRAAYGVSPSSVALVYFGFLSPGKGVEFLLEAFEQLPPDLDARLWMLADREPAYPRYAAYHRKIAEQLAAMKWADRVTWTGYLPAAEVSAYLASADLGVFPYEDGVSLRRTTLLAALAHGLPVLSTGDQAPLPGIRVVPPCDSAALASALAGLARDRQALGSLAAEAASAGASLSWQSIAEHTREVYARYWKT